MTPYEPTLLGVINLSPESMVTDSIAAGAEAALERAKWLREHGAAIVDIGGRSITPDEAVVGDRAEQQRLEHVVRALVREGFAVSVDTWSPETACRALSWGCRFVNYTRGELPDTLLEQVARAGAALVLTYMPYGDAYRMRDAPRVPDRVDAILEFLSPRIERARAAGVAELIVDPNLGILHPTTDDHRKAHWQLEVLANVDRIRALGCPVLLYAARKPERLARILFAEAVLRARPEYVRTHDPATIARLQQVARETAG